MGGAPSVQAPKPPDPAQEFQAALSTYISQAPALYKEESQYQPMYNQMQQGIQGSNLQYYTGLMGQLAPQAQQALDVTQRWASLGALQNYQQFAGQAGQAAMAASPALQQLYGYSQGQLGAGADPTLQGILGGIQQQLPGQVQQLQDLGAQAGRSMQPINQQLQSLYGQVMPMATQGAGDIRGIAGQAAADTRSPL